MKINTQLKSVLLFIPLCINSFMCYNQENFLPENITVSFNGTFVTKNVNDEFKATSDNGLFKAKYDIGAVTDEQRELLNTKLYRDDRLLYSIENVQGSDLYISNAGYMAVLDMHLHFIQQVSIRFYDNTGKYIYSGSFEYASLFGFSPMGEKFVVGTDKELKIINLRTGRSNSVECCSKFAFSEDEQILATAKESRLIIYQQFQQVYKINTDFFYPRGIAVSSDKKQVFIIDKKNLKAFSLLDYKELFEKKLPENYSYRNLMPVLNAILAGVHYRNQGISSGILMVYNSNGDILNEKEIATKNYEVFPEMKSPQKSSAKYDQISWPFIPFDEVHKVWNHYEQHMGDGTGYWAYLHQGLDLEVPVGEPVYAVEEGYVKLVLTIGGASYWRLAISPDQVSGYSNGWLYAHLIESSIQVDVGDYVELHDYLGDIIYWSDDWGHIHFVNIHDQGTIWYYDDDEWGINFNPLLALNPITDAVAPVIENFSAGSKFGFCVNETSNYLDSDSLYADVDIIVKISDYHGDSEWEQPAFRTYYWLNSLPDNTLVFPKTLGQILNHTYEFYNSGSYEAYAPLIYKKDDLHPSPHWMNETRDYFQILTNNNGDSIAELSETNLAFPTTDYPDGNYRIFVEAWDEFGNMDYDSMDVNFDNFNTGFSDLSVENNKIFCFPNPAADFTTFVFDNEDELLSPVLISIYNNSMMLLQKYYYDSGDSSQSLLKIDLDGLTSGLYFYKIVKGKNEFAGKLIIR